MKTYEASTEFINTFTRKITKTNNNQHKEKTPSGSTGTNKPTTTMETTNTPKTKDISRISSENWKNEIIREILDAPTIRQSVQEVGYGLSEIIDCLIDDCGNPDRPNSYTFIEKEIKRYEEYSNQTGCRKKELCIWKAVDEVMELYSCQLLMTDEEVEDATYDPKILSGLEGSNHHCHHSAFIAIFKSLQDYLIAWINASEPVWE
jgi:hypothetical protein